MIQKYLKVVALPAIFILLMSLIEINANTQDILIPDNPIQPREVLINGHIKNYKGVEKTGSLIFLEAVTRLRNPEVFSIDSTGNFITSFYLVCPTMNSYIQIGRTFFSLYLVPGEIYNLTITEGKGDEYSIGTQVFSGENSDLYKDVYELSAAIKSSFKKDENKRQLYYLNDSSNYQSLEKFCDDLLLRKIAFVDEYCKKEKINQKASDLIKLDLTYEPAHALIIYRNLYSTRYRRNREGLPENFYPNLYAKFPINNPEAIGSNYYSMYISNIKDIIWENYYMRNEIFDYLKENQKFSDRELFLISKLYKNDTIFKKTEEFTEFFNRRQGEITDLSNKYWAKMLLDSVGHFPKGLGRDLIISQGISDFYLDEKTLSPSPDEWIRIDSLISNKNILYHLKKIDQYNQALATVQINSKSNILPPLLQSETDRVFEKLIGKYKGKVVYIDFWATWCGPCRQEIPHSKVLSAHFAGQEVVFLNLCNRSDKKNWEFAIKSEQIAGDHYLLSPDEYNILSKLFNIQGVPTYALIDKKGNIINKNAPRPSEGTMTIKAIESLLNE